MTFCDFLTFRGELKQSRKSEMGRETQSSSHIDQIRAEPPPLSEPVPVVKEELLSDAKSDFNPADFQPAADYEPAKSRHNNVGQL